MGKRQAIDSILEQAIAAFAQWGVEGASLRTIASNAGVPLSTIDNYFGTKRQLYLAVVKLVWDEISTERNQAIGRVLAANPGEPPALEAVIDAMVRPVVRRAMSREQTVRDRLYFLQHRYREHAALWGGDMDRLDGTVAPWIDALARSCPELKRHDAVWAFSYCAGVMYSMQLMERRYDAFLEGDAGRTAADVTRDIVAFCRAGVEAMVRLRRADA